MQPTRSAPQLRISGRILLALLLPLLLSLIIIAEEPTPPGKVYLALSATTERVASAYVDAYFRMDFDTMEQLSGPETSFDDPTADTLFGGAPVPGRAAVFGHLRTTFAGITQISFLPSRRYFSGEHGVFEGEVTWGFRPSPGASEKITSGMPLIVIVQVKDGLVVSHRDYGDYRVFLAQARTRRENSGP